MVKGWTVRKMCELVRWKGFGSWLVDVEKEHVAEWVVGASLRRGLNFMVRDESGHLEFPFSNLVHSRTQYCSPWLRLGSVAAQDSLRLAQLHCHFRKSPPQLANRFNHSRGSLVLQPTPKVGQTARQYAAGLLILIGIKVCKVKIKSFTISDRMWSQGALHIASEVMEF